MAALLMTCTIIPDNLGAGLSLTLLKRNHVREHAEGTERILLLWLK